MTTSNANLTGFAAIEYAEEHGLALSKYTDPTEGARDGLTVGEAREVAAEDPSLVYLAAAAAYTWRMGSDDIDPHATIDGDESARAAAYDRFCELAEAWLDEHEGDALSISVRALRPGEIAGLYLDAGGRERILDSADPDHDEARAMTDAAYEAAWAALNAELQD